MTIQVTLEVQEVQFIMNAVAKQPFEQVADLWFKIKAQAEQQLAKEQAKQTATAAQEDPAPGLNDPELA